MNEADDYRKLFRDEAPIRPDAQARDDAITAAMARFTEMSARPQETRTAARLRNWMANIWNRRPHMRAVKLNHALMAGAGLAGLVTLMVASPALHHVMTDVAAPPPVKKAQDRVFAQQQEAAPPPMIAQSEPEQAADAVAAVAEAARAAPTANLMPELDPAVTITPETNDRFTAFNANPVKQAAEEPLSTFSIDTDTSSYGFIRRALMGNYLPPKDAVRVEEMINYFPYDYEGPTARAEPFKANVSLMQTPWNPDTKLMRIGIKGFSLNGVERPRSNLVFLIDTSGSMEEPDKLPLLINSFRLLLDTLSPNDSVAIVTYAGSAGTVLEPTRASEKGKILAALDGLTAGGSTAGAAGIAQAYNLAEQSFDKAGVNRVILATDGDFNVGISDPRELQDFVERKRESGIYLSVLGFGEGNYNDTLMQALAQNGNGNAAYIDTLNESRKVLVEEATSTLFPIANDVKIQVEFNPAAVSEYRLIGYETRLLDREDFNNDRVDAGDIGAGHAVTALYEVTPRGSKGQHVDALRYGTAEAPAAPSGEYAFVKIRYKLPGETESRLITEPVTAASETASSEASFAAAVAAFGQLLRGGEFTGSFGYDDVIALANANRGPDAYGYRSEFVTLVRLAKSARPMP